MLADTLADAVVHTLAGGGWVFQLNIVVTAGGANDRKPKTAEAPVLWPNQTVNDDLMSILLSVGLLYFCWNR